MSLISALRALSLTAFSLWLQSVAANPITPADVRAERQWIGPAAAREKRQAILMLAAARETLLARQANSGISPIDNKLLALDTSTVVAVPEKNLPGLPARGANGVRAVIVRNFTTCQPTNSLACYLNAAGCPEPDLHLSPEELRAGVNVLVPWRTAIVPACLSPAELEDYLSLRFDFGFSTGAYWSELSAGRLNDELLARLRYYDYLDLIAPMHPVLVFHATEMRSRTH